MELLLLLIKRYKRDFTPIEVSKELKVTNRTVINRLAVLAKNGFVVPMMVNQRIRSYKLSDFTKEHEKKIGLFVILYFFYRALYNVKAPALLWR